MKLCGINIKCHHHDELFQVSDDVKIVVTVNSEAIVRSQTDIKLKNIINNSLTTIDGQIPLWLFRLKYRRSDVEKISGSELIYTLPEFAAHKNLRVFLLGGKEDSNSESVLRLKKLYAGLQISGYSPPYSPYPFSSEINESIFNHIASIHPQILFVGFGMGKQEFWAYDNIDRLSNLGVKLIIGCGGSFEFASGKIKRAPKIIQNIGMEGIWRLLCEMKWFRFKRLLLSSKIFYFFLVDIFSKRNENKLTHN